MIFATVKQQWCAVGIKIELDDLADKYDMITSAISVGDLAFEDGECSCKHRAARFTEFVVNRLPLVAFGGCKLVGQMLLALAQYVDRKVIGAHVSAKRMGLLTETPEYQRRIQRDRVERTGCVANQLAIWADGRDDRNTGRKTPQALAKGLGVHCCFFCSHVVIHPIDVAPDTYYQIRNDVQQARVTMQAVSDGELMRQFLGWQCRVRQIAMRQHGGRPSQGMSPKVLDLDGKVIMPAVTVLLIPSEPDSFTKFFEFQVQKSPDPKQTYEAALKMFQGEYFQKPKSFSDLLAAQFGAESQVAATLLEMGECILEFEQFNQGWKIHCDIRRLDQHDKIRQHVLAHNRLFNRNIASDATVLGLTPHWHSANADPIN